MHFEVLTFAELAEAPDMTIWRETDSFCLNQILYLALKCMAIFNVVSDGTGMECANGISIVANRTLVRGRRWQHSLGTYQFELKQLCQRLSISHRDDIESSRSTVFLLLLILLTRRLMSWRVKRSIIPLRSTSFVLRYNSRHNGHISSWSKIGLYAQPCGSKPDNAFV